MSNDILINITPQETRVAIVVQGATQELQIERTLLRGITGNIYLGKVVRVLPGMQSAFIDIGLERAAFLHIADIWEARSHDSQATAAPKTPIEHILFDGQSLMVQVAKDPIGTKGARLSTQISIAGRMLVFLPQERHIGISQRIGMESERQQLRQRVQDLVSTGDAGGFIIRTMAEEASDNELLSDIAYLRKTWATINSLSRSVPAPALLYQDLTLAQRVLRDFVDDETRMIQVDSTENHTRLVAFANMYTPSVTPRLQHYRGERPLFELYGVEAQLQDALSRKVALKSGGYLIIDQTEAMTTIDVNTGSYVNGRNFDETVFKTNLEAAHEIARQLRLRNLGGIIILDFIDMTKTDHQAAVLDDLKKSLLRDRAKKTVSDFSPLGLVEMTRKRTRESLAHIMCESCPVCSGRGQIKTARTVCYEILREVLREAKQFNPGEFRILAAQVVIDLFLEEESQHLAMLSEFIKKPISLQVDTLFPQEQYDIVLM